MMLQTDINAYIYIYLIYTTSIKILISLTRGSLICIALLYKKNLISNILVDEDVMCSILNLYVIEAKSKTFQKIYH